MITYGTTVSLLPPVVFRRDNIPTAFGSLAMRGHDIRSGCFDPETPPITGLSQLHTGGSSLRRGKSAPRHYARMSPSPFASIAVRRTSDKSTTQHFDIAAER